MLDQKATESSDCRRSETNQSPCQPSQFSNISSQWVVANKKQRCMSRAGRSAPARAQAQEGLLGLLLKLLQAKQLPAHKDPVRRERGIRHAIHVARVHMRAMNGIMPTEIMTGLNQKGIYPPWVAGTRHAGQSPGRSRRRAPRRI